MVTVFKTHGFKWFAVVMVFTMSRLEMKGSGETRFGAIQLTVSGQVCGLVTVRFTIPGLVCGLVSVRFELNNLVLPKDRNLPCLQLKACIHRFVPTLLYFDIHHLPSSRPLGRLHMLDALVSYFLLRRNEGVVFLKPWFHFRNIICSSTFNGLEYLPARCQSKQTAKKICAPLGNWSPRPRSKDDQRVLNGADTVAPHVSPCPEEASARSCGAKNLAARSRTRLLRRFALDI